MSRNRLRKKCFIVSLGMHLLLLLLVVFGVAFAATQKKEEPVKYLSISLFREPAPQKPALAAAGGTASGPSYSGATTYSPTSTAACAQKTCDYAEDNSRT